MNIDMTKGKAVNTLIVFSIPLLIANLIQQSYNVVDSIIVARLLGMNAFAAVGATGGFAFMFVGFVMGITSGFGVIMATEFGAKNYQKLRQSICMSCILCLGIILPLTTLAILLQGKILVWMQTPSEILEMASEYIVIIFAGMIFTVLFNLFAGISRAVGDSTTPLIFMIGSSAANIVLNFVFIGAFHLGVGGAAYATIASQGVAGTICGVYLMKKFPFLLPEKSDWKIEKEMCRRLLKIGVPIGFQQSITAIGVMALQGAINGLGTLYIAAYTCGSRIIMLFAQIINSLGTGISTYAAQNLGAGKHARIKEGVRAAFLITLSYSAVVFVVLLVFGRFMVGWFVDDSQTQVIDIGVYYLRWLGATFWCMSILGIFRGALSGVGNGWIPMLSGAIELIARVSAALIFVKIAGFTGIIISEPMAWFFANILMFIYWKKECKKLGEDKHEVLKDSPGAAEGNTQQF